MFNDDRNTTTARDQGGTARPGEEVCVLVSASCTIAWADQSRGALWLCPSGVLRVPLDRQAIARQGAGPTVDPNMPWEATFTRAQFDDAARLGGGFRWHPRTDIASARFEPGQPSNAFHLQLRDRNRVKFLWLASDGGQGLVDEWIAGGGT
jgi:hypothetical protein